MDFYIKKLLSEFVHVNNMNDVDPRRQIGIQNSNLFTTMVDLLRNGTEVQNVEINKLGALCWDLVGNNICPFTMTSVPSLSFWSEYNSKTQASVAFIMCPEKWIDLVKENHFMQFGAVVCAASKARDYWNRKLTSNEELMNSNKRGYAYEAEFLKFALSKEKFKLNEYQLKVMNHYPNGLASLENSLRYESRPYPDDLTDIDAKPPFPVDIGAFTG